MNHYFFWMNIVKGLVREMNFWGYVFCLIFRETLEASLFWQRPCSNASVRIINPNWNVRGCVRAKSQVFSLDPSVSSAIWKTQGIHGLFLFNMA